ncbi:hypothetical protein HK102_011212, partial [Quaeritorhiza haematococci]
MKDAMTDLKNRGEESLVETLLKKGTFHHNPPSTLSSSIDFYDPTLNESQREAVAFALTAPHLALIHGPP